MLLILHVDNSPPVLPATHTLTINDNSTFGTDDSERNHIPNLLVQLDFLVVILLGVKRIQTDVVVDELSADLSTS
jgi:hypothetical protein